MSDKLTFSFLPGEIINQGDPIEITATNDVDPSSAQDVVNIVRGGQPENLSITVSGNTVKVPTSDLKTGGYDLVVGELMDMSNNRLARLVVRPLIIKASKAPKAAASTAANRAVRIEHSVMLAIADTTVSRLIPGERKPPGTTFVERMKAVDVDTGMPIDLAFDEDDQPVDARKLLAAVQHRRFQKYGRIDEALWRHVQGKPAEEVVDVIVWPRITTSIATHKKRGLEEGIPEEERQLLDKVKAMRDSIAQTVHRLDGELQVPPEPTTQTLLEVPFVEARVRVGQLDALAKEDHVGVVFFDDYSPINDLKDSIAVQRTNIVHQLGSTGAGVKVAVYETGPRNLTDLSFADRYLSNPSDSNHARMTSGIVKNTKAGDPHGHAPDCDLYSANSDDKKAILWAAEKGCTVISQSFHYRNEALYGTLQPNDLLHDWMALRSPYPTIVHASGNFWNGDPDNIKPPSDEYVNHKGYNTLSIGNHDDEEFIIGGSSVYRNPTSTNGDRELPELCANGTTVTVVGLTGTGTSLAAPAVAGVLAVLQSANTALKMWPEACRAVLLAGSNRQLTNSTWWADVGSARRDSKVGAGAVDAQVSYQIALKQVSLNNAAEPRAWSASTVSDSSFGSTDKLSTFYFKLRAPGSPTSPFDRLRAKVALAWNSEVTTTSDNQVTASVLKQDLDLLVYDSKGEMAGCSASFDNSYEVVDFNAIPGETYQIRIRRWSGSGSSYFGIAWTVEQTSWLLERPGNGGFSASLNIAMGTSSAGAYETTNIASSVSAGAKNSAVLAFGAAEPTTPNVVVGINMVDMGNTSSNFWVLRIKSYLSDVTKEQFTPHIDSWNNTMLYNARLSWLMLDQAEPGVQCGRFESYGGSGDNGNIIETVKFPRAFSKKPIVYVGLSGWDLGDNWRLHCQAVKVTTDSFEMQIVCWGSSKIYWASATWIAIDPDKPGWLTGEIKGSSNTATWSGHVSFAQPFLRTPAMFTALTYFDVSHFHNFRLRVKTEAKDDGFDWKMETWSDTELYKVQASWLALELPNWRLREG